MNGKPLAISEAPMKQLKRTSYPSTLALLLFATACGGGGGGGGGGAENDANIELTATTDGAVTPMGASVEILVGNNDVGSAEEVVITSEPGHGTLSGESPVAITYTPEPGFVGLDTFEYRIQSGDAASESALVQVLVIEEVVYLDGEGLASTLRYVLTDGENKLSSSEAFQGLPADSQGVPFADEGDFEPAPLFQQDASSISEYVASPNGRWIAARGVQGALVVGPSGNSLTLIDRLTHVKTPVISVPGFVAITDIRFSESGGHLLFCTQLFGGELKTLGHVPLEGDLSPSEIAVPEWGVGQVISYELSPDADVCAVRIKNAEDDGDKLYAMDLNVGLDSFQSMSPGEPLGGTDRTCPEYAWKPGAGPQTLIYRTDIGAGEEEYQLRGRELALSGSTWRIDTDNGGNPNPAVADFAISPDGTSVAYRKDGGIPGKHALYKNTTSKFALGNAGRVLTPNPGATTIGGYVWDASSEMVFAQTEEPGLVPGFPALHVQAVVIGPGSNVIVSDAKGIKEGLVALGDADGSGVIFQRGFLDVFDLGDLGPKINVPTETVEVWNRETQDSFVFTVALEAIADVRLSNDGERIGILGEGGTAKQVQVTDALLHPFSAEPSELAGPGMEIKSNGFVFTPDSSRWVYLDNVTKDLILSGVEMGEQVLAQGRPTCRQITALPGLSD